MIAESPQIRDATLEDVPFLASMLVAAATWRPGGARRSPEDLLQEASLRVYIEGWGRAGDTGLIAWDSRPLGAAWYRFFEGDNHGYGFISESIPELSIGVRASERGRGIGTALLNGLIERARIAGIPALSLSIESDNPAVRLYERIGFERIDTDGSSWTMLRELTSS